MMSAVRPFLILVVALTFLNCGKKDEVKPQIRPPQRPPAPPAQNNGGGGTTTPPAATTPGAATAKMFDGQWISDCERLGPTTNSWYANYFWFEDGGFFEERIWYSASTCQMAEISDYESYSGYFTLAGNSATVPNAKYVDINYYLTGTYQPDPNYIRYDTFLLKDGKFFKGADGGAIDGRTPGTRRVEILERPYKPYAP